MERRRIIELDALRAVAIISMTIGHVANYSFIWRVSHFPYYVWDGSQLFMLVSGIVVGIVYRPIVRRLGLRPAAAQLARRAGLIYLIQVALVAMAIWAYFVVNNAQTQQFRPAFATSMREALTENLTLGVNPIYVNFLSVYVLLLLLAIPGLWLLAHGWWRFLLALAAVQYVVASFHHRLFTLPFGWREDEMFNAGTWSTLFLTGMVVGWHWRDWRVEHHLRERWVTWFATPALLVLVAFAVVDVVQPTLLGPVNWLFDKQGLGPGRFLASWVFFVALWWGATEIATKAWGWRVLQPLAVLGARSLDAVVIVTVAAILVPTLLNVASESKLAEVLSLVVLALCWGWAYLRRDWQRRRDMQRGPEAHGLEPSR